MQGLEGLESQIASAGVAVLAVGAAVLLLMVSIRVIDWLRSAVGEPAETVDQDLIDFAEAGPDLQEMDDERAFSDYESEFDGGATCPSCGVNTADDHALFYDPETGERFDDLGDECPQCGAEMIEWEE